MRELLGQSAGQSVPFTVASVPITDEPWRPLGEGELLMISKGQVVHP